MYCQGYNVSYTGFPPYLENFENLEFCHLLFHAWNLLKEGGKHESLNQNLEEKKLEFWKFDVSILTFQDVFAQKIIYI